MDRGAWWATVPGVPKSRIRHDWSDRDACVMTGNIVSQTLYLKICANVRFSVRAFWRWLFVVSEDEQQILSRYSSWIMSLTLLKTLQMSLTLLKTLQMLLHNLHYFKLKKSLKPDWFFSSFVGNLFFFLPRCWQEFPFCWEIKNIFQICVLLINFSWDTVNLLDIKTNFLS